LVLFPDRSLILTAVPASAAAPSNALLRHLEPLLVALTARDDRDGGLRRRGKDEREGDGGEAANAHGHGPSGTRRNQPQI
jgi:hypothetical protein